MFGVHDLDFFGHTETYRWAACSVLTISNHEKGGVVAFREHDHLL